MALIFLLAHMLVLLSYVLWDEPFSGTLYTASISCSPRNRRKQFSRLYTTQWYRSMSPHGVLFAQATVSSKNPVGFPRQSNQYSISSVCVGVGYQTDIPASGPDPHHIAHFWPIHWNWVTLKLGQTETGSLTRSPRRVYTCSYGCVQASNTSSSKGCIAMHCIWQIESIHHLRT